MNVKLIIISILLAVSFINPFVERLEFESPVLYMLSHYALIASGSLLGYTLLRSAWYNLVLGILPIIFWHLPVPFSLGASFIQFRILLEISIFLGGFLLGSALLSVAQWVKVTLFALYMIGDTVLSILFVIASPLYSNRNGVSPYPPDSLPLAGISMIVVMNLILAGVIYISFKTLLEGKL
ncbi:MAG: DUF1404 domain-containing protein [Metallosphaera sp.]|uniref:DUF1404 domain-containing protein n=1 Tax=Metallosphaera sp. TaxID=2020860 RepID=UPI003162B36C